jgi:hypothetical protein
MHETMFKMTRTIGRARPKETRGAKILAAIAVRYLSQLSTVKTWNALFRKESAGGEQCR